MTNNILQTDIELAKGMLTSNAAVEDIVAALVTRGIDAASARQLLEDLRSGKTTTPTFRPEAVSRHAPADSAGSEAAPQESSSAERRRVRLKRRRSNSNRRRSAERYWSVIAVLICLFGIGAGVVLYKYKYRARTQFLLDQLDVSARTVETEKTASRQSETAFSSAQGFRSDEFDRYRVLTNRIAGRKLTPEEAGALQSIVTKIERLGGKSAPPASPAASH